MKNKRYEKITPFTEGMHKQLRGVELKVKPEQMIEELPKDYKNILAAVDSLEANELVRKSAIVNKCEVYVERKQNGR